MRYVITMTSPCPHPAHTGQKLYFAGSVPDARAPSGMADEWSTAPVCTWDTREDADIVQREMGYAKVEELQ